MQFTQIHQISSFLNCTLQQNHTENYDFQNDSWVKQVTSDQILREPLFQEVMKNLDKLNIEKLNTEDQSLKIKCGQISQINIYYEKSSDFQNQQNQQNYEKFDKSKSLIFRSTLTNLKSVTELKGDQKYIKVFYFSSPIMKLVPYNKKSTIKDLILKSLDIYLQENYDAIKANLPYEKFEFRFPINQNQCLPDMNIQPLDYDRFPSENLFQILILVEKPKKDDAWHTKPTKQYSLQDSNMSWSNSLQSQNGFSSQTVRLSLMDDTYYQLMTIQLQKQGILQKLFTQIKQNNLHGGKQFVIREDPESEFDLAPDHQVKLIERNRLYIMPKIYMDQTQQQMTLAPIRLKSFISTQFNNYLPPIGINEASRYEQFEVTKISSLGIAIDRILGIDQTKIYNYIKQLRQNKKQLSFVDKFLGFNKQTGTKKPYKLIKDIKQINRFPGGLQVTFPQKITTFIIKNETALQKVYRKLNFLIQWHKSRSSTHKQQK